MKYLLQEAGSDGDDEGIDVVVTIQEVDVVADDLDDKAEEIKPKLALGLPKQSLLWNLQGLVAYWKGINIGS
jgi:hypothetical protein